MQFSVTIDNTLRIVAITNRAETLTICIINTEWTGFMLLNGLGDLHTGLGQALSKTWPQPVHLSLIGLFVQRHYLRAANTCFSCLCRICRCLHCMGFVATTMFLQKLGSSPHYSTVVSCLIGGTVVVSTLDLLWSRRHR